MRVTAFQRQIEKGQEDRIEAEDTMTRRELGGSLGEGTIKAKPCDGKELDLSGQKRGGQCG